jgi:cystathionine beta-lyase/cystathionine gamma-synthase
VNGHSDVVGGALLTSNPELYAAYQFRQNAVGAVPSPFDCWLTLRGLRTLSVRMRQHEANALAVARFLEADPRVETAVYPGLESHPQHALARRQMDGFGAMVTFRIPGGQEAADRFVRALKVFIFAESLGGVESLACHPATMSHATLSEAERLAIGITPGTIRLSVGIEDSQDLIEDLDAALDAARV